MNKKQETGKKTKEPVTARVKLTLQAQERFFGPGICELLEKIGETGSIQAAAAGMKMSYTKAWKILNRAEEEMGVNLITRVNGGRNGGSSTLTEAGEKAIRAFREMEAKLAQAGSELLETYYAVFRNDDAAAEAGQVLLTEAGNMRKDTGKL